jgi:hypothetical protein
MIVLSEEIIIHFTVTNQTCIYINTVELHISTLNTEIVAKR